eukprot:TRINITY_DN32148_c0_g1_i2.p1 TRINITY_DN32148_c0_g1~~TRINITY_DN32148_c0_g1_i2.p1  ORF type:complete len:359 (+),score=82.30 TRINITY_DN32148_c0_g1_i2:79-1077(+)
MPSLWPIGVGVSLIGTFSSGLGDNLVRLSYHQIEHLPEDERPPVYHLPYWVLGWCLTIVIDTGCNALALALAPLALIIPLGAMHILWGSVFAHLINHEHMGVRDMIGALTIVIGCVLVLCSAPHDSSDRTFDETLHLLESNAFICGQSVAALLVIVCVYICAFVHVESLRTVAAPALSGVLGSSSNLMLKMSESLAEEDVRKWQFFAVAASTVFLAVSQLMSLNNALKNGEACTVVAVANSVLLVGGSVQGLVVFRPPEPPSKVELIMLVSGIVVVCLGIAMLSQRKHDELEELPEADEEVGCDSPNQRLSDTQSPTNYQTICSSDAINGDE